MPDPIKKTRQSADRRSSTLGRHSKRRALNFPRTERQRTLLKLGAFSRVGLESNVQKRYGKPRACWNTSCSAEQSAAFTSANASVELPSVRKSSRSASQWLGKCTSLTVYTMESLKTPSAAACTRHEDDSPRIAFAHFSRSANHHLTDVQRYVAKTQQAPWKRI